MEFFWQKLTRKKEMSMCDGDVTHLHRCINVYELTMMGIGGMVGSGIYFLVGTASKTQAGPSIVVSFILAAVVVALAATCYMEFATRVSKTGSIYLYMYMTLGEFMAFLAGWCALMGTISGSATNGRAWSAYLDSLFHHSISNFTEKRIAKWTVGDPITEYPDFVAAAIIIFMTLIVASGANCSAKFNAAFAGFNVCILCFCVIVGFIYGDIKNWTNPETGGFFPFGWAGVIQGAGTCFWAFTGFEIIATTVEEAKNPKQSIPIATGSAIGMVTVLYISTAAALTFVTSYKELDTSAPLPSAFSAKHLNWAYYIVSIGPLCGLTTTLFSGIYSFVRIAYAMSQDGLLFPFCHSVNQVTKVPMWTTLSGGFITATIACFFEMKNIIDFGIIVALMQFVLVDACVIILRYRPMKEDTRMPVKLPSDEDLTTGAIISSPYQWKITKFRETAVMNHGLSESMNNLLDEEPDDFTADTLNHDSHDSITSDNLEHLESVSQASLDLNDTGAIYALTGTLKPAFKCLKFLVRLFPRGPGDCVYISVILLSILLTLVACLVVYGNEHLEQGSWWTILVLTTLFFFVAFTLFVINAHHQSSASLALKVPCLPWLPAISLFLCILLMVSAADYKAWLSFLFVLFLGVCVYFSYGIHHSVLNTEQTRPSNLHEDTYALLDNLSDDEL